MLGCLFLLRGSGCAVAAQSAEQVDMGLGLQQLGLDLATPCGVKAALGDEAGQEAVDAAAIARFGQARGVCRRIAVNARCADPLCDGGLHGQGIRDFAKGRLDRAFITGQGGIAARLCDRDISLPSAKIKDGGSQISASGPIPCAAAEQAG